MGSGVVRIHRLLSCSPKAGFSSAQGKCSVLFQGSSRVGQCED